MVGIKYGLAIGIGAVVASLLTGGARAIEIEAAAQTASVAGEPSAVPKAVGIAAPNALFSGLAEHAVAQGSIPLENPTSRAVLRLLRRRADAPGAGDLPSPTTTSRRRRPSRTRTPTSCSRPARAPTRPTTTAPTSSSRATRAGSRRLHHADQPRRRRGPPGDDARRHRHRRHSRCRRSTARPGTRSRSACSSPPRAARDGGVWQATLDYPSTVEDISGIARPGRLRGHPERPRRQRLDRRGRGGATARQHARQAAEQLHLPLRAGRTRPT